MPHVSDAASLADAAWERRQASRKRWDQAYRWLNGGLFLLLAAAAILYFLGLWDLVAPHFVRSDVLGGPAR
jgi:hypothetical protein